MTNKLTKKEIINLLPHREPMLLIDEFINIIDDLYGEKQCLNPSLQGCDNHPYEKLR